jgi:23S rRNA (uracil1939-C5)-methyltransferase
MLIDQFSRIAGVKVEDYALLPKLQAKTLGYRRKARLAARYVSKKGGVLVGFREKGSGFVMDMNHCEILCDEVGVLIEPLRRLLSALDGREKIPQIEIAVGETAPKKASKKVVALVFRHLTELSADDFQALLDFGERERVEIYLQPGGAETVRKLFPPDQRARLYYYLPTYDLRMSFHPSDFTQINGELNSLVIDRAISMLDLNQSDSVLDLFCGLGNFTLPMARKAATVIGVEASIEMVGRARENALSNQVNNAEFCVDDLYKPLQGSLWLSKGYNKVLLDPPRSGAREIIPTLLALHPEKILYVSCNPATLARDTFDLMSGGYKLKSAGVMDMFPHTTHVESIAEFVPN